MVNPLFATILISSNLQSVAIPGQDCGEIKNNNNINNKNTLHQKNHQKKKKTVLQQVNQLRFWSKSLSLSEKQMWD